MEGSLIARDIFLLLLRSRSNQMRGSILFSLVAIASAQRREMRTFTIDLDKDPEDRFTEVTSDPFFNATIWDYYNENIAPNPDLQKVLYGISDKRGDENEEMMGEITGIVAASKLPFEFVKAIQMLNELTRWDCQPALFVQQQNSQPKCS